MSCNIVLADLELDATTEPMHHDTAVEAAFDSTGEDTCIGECVNFGT